MNKRAFTILEIIVICIIVGILSALAIPYFQNIIEKSNAEVCGTNLKAYQKAVDIYIQENDEVPATLAALPQEDVNRAFAELMEEKGAWRRRLAFFIRDIQEHGLAYAASEYFPRLRCPKDLTPPPAGISYGLNSQIVVMTAQNYRTSDPRLMVILDCDAAVCLPGAGALRHKRLGNIASPVHALYMIGITREGVVGNSDSSSYPYIPYNP